MYIYSTFNRFSQFALAALDHNDIESINLLKVAMELAMESKNVERCFEGNEFTIPEVRTLQFCRILSSRIQIK